MQALDKYRGIHRIEHIVQTQIGSDLLGNAVIQRTGLRVIAADNVLVEALLVCAQKAGAGIHAAGQGDALGVSVFRVLPELQFDSCSEKLVKLVDHAILGGRDVIDLHGMGDQLRGTSLQIHNKGFKRIQIENLIQVGIIAVYIAAEKHMVQGIQVDVGSISLPGQNIEDIMVTGTVADEPIIAAVEHGPLGHEIVGDQNLPAAFVPQRQRVQTLRTQNKLRTVALVELNQNLLIVGTAQRLFQFCAVEDHTVKMYEVVLVLEADLFLWELIVPCGKGELWLASIGDDAVHRFHNDPTFCKFCMYTITGMQP